MLQQVSLEYLLDSYVESSKKDAAGMDWEYYYGDEPENSHWESKGVISHLEDDSLVPMENREIVLQKSKRENAFLMTMQLQGVPVMSTMFHEDEVPKVPENPTGDPNRCFELISELWSVAVKSAKLKLN